MRSHAFKTFAATALLTTMVSVSIPAAATTVGPDEGCTPGYWKNHTQSWEEYAPNTTLGSLFTIPAPLASFSGQTMLGALNGGGGPGVTGAATIMFRAATAAYLNAAHEGVGYPLRRFTPSPYEPWASDPRLANGIKGAVNDALASLDRPTILAPATATDGADNLGCPLN